MEGKGNCDLESRGNNKFKGEFEWREIRVEVGIGVVAL